MNKLRTIRISATAICFVQIAMIQWIVPNMLLACPTCKNGMNDDGSAAAYAISILLMMGMPFVILTCWVTTVFRLRAKMDIIPVESEQQNHF